MTEAKPIKVSQFRDNHELSAPSQKPIKESLRLLLLAELAFGGVITKIDETKLVVSTSVMGCQDVTVFEGTNDDLLLLLEAAYYWAIIKCNASDKIYDGVINHVFKKYPQGSLIPPREVVMGAELANMFAGARIAKAIMAGMIVDETDAALVPELITKREEDLFTVVIMTRLEGVGVREAIALM